MRIADWDKEELKLRNNHTWKATPGCRTFVADKGAVRFDFPDDWVVIPDNDSIKFYDKTPPDDDSCMAVSYLRLPPADWESLSLASLVESATAGDTRPISDFGPIHEERKGALTIAWREMRFVDPSQQRECFSRLCLAREGRIQALITFEFWVDDAERGGQAWTAVLGNLQLGEWFDDPTHGPMIT